MPILTARFADLYESGPVIDIALRPSSQLLAIMRANNQPEPLPVPVRALIDTGAKDSALQQGIAAKLGLQPIGQQLVSTPTCANVNCSRFAMSFIFPRTAGLATETTVDAFMTEVPLQIQGIQCLIGRDILRLCIFNWSGPESSISISV